MQQRRCRGLLLHVRTLFAPPEPLHSPIPAATHTAPTSRPARATRLARRPSAMPWVIPGPSMGVSSDPGCSRNIALTQERLARHQMLEEGEALSRRLGCRRGQTAQEEAQRAQEGLRPQTRACMMLQKAREEQCHRPPEQAMARYVRLFLGNEGLSQVTIGCISDPTYFFQRHGQRRVVLHTFGCMVVNST